MCEKNKTISNRFKEVRYDGYVNKSSLIIVLSCCHFPFLAKFISSKPTMANITNKSDTDIANHSIKVKKKQIDWKVVYSWLAFIKSVFYGFDITHSQKKKKKTTSRQWMRHTESEIFLTIFNLNKSHTANTTNQTIIIRAMYEICWIIGF